MNITIHRPPVPAPAETLRHAILRRRISGPDHVVKLLGELAFGPPADGAWAFPMMREVRAHG